METKVAQRTTSGSWRVVSLSIAVACVLQFVPPAAGQQFDAPYVDARERNEQRWADEDRQIDRKLADLERRFGKKPNIIYILADDVGWGEMGWQGGGKHRGTPTPELDRMALEGMRFWSAYAEPSCTPSRIAINTGRHPVRTGLLSVLWPGQIKAVLCLPSTLEVVEEGGQMKVLPGAAHVNEILDLGE